MQAMPEIIIEKCNGCGLCVAVCQCDAFVIVDKVACVVEVNDCHFCTNCELVCPTGAIICRYEIVFENSI